MSRGALPLLAMPPGSDADVMLPVADDEAVWLGFELLENRAVAVLQVWVVTPLALNAVTGLATSSRRHQDYVVCPPQRSLDGIQDGPARARQFVRRAADPSCFEVEILRLDARLRQIGAAGPPPGRGPLRAGSDQTTAAARRAVAGKELRGVPQTIIQDPEPMAVSDRGPSASVHVLFADPEAWSTLAGRAAPSPMTDDDRYSGLRLP